MKIVYDGQILMNTFKKNSGRTGIFWVARNLINNLYKSIDKKEDLVLYFDSVYHYYLFKKNKQEFLFLKNIKCIGEDYKNINKLLNTCKKYEKFLFLKNNSKNQIVRGFFNLLKSIYRKEIKRINKKYKEIIEDYFFKNYQTKTPIFFLSPYNAFPDFINNNDKIKKALVLHDTIPIDFPQYYGDLYAENNSEYAKMIRSLNKEIYYFCVSENTKKDFLRHFSDKLDENKMFVMPIATSQEFYPERNEEKFKETLDKYNISKEQRKKYIFSLCTIEPRKNLIFTIKCFIKFIKENNINDLYFYLGGGYWDSFIKDLEKEIDDLDIYKDKIVKVGYIDDGDINILYSNSLFFTYISIYEGFGIPPLEAMSCGTPVLTSNTSSIPEVVGNSAIMIDPKNEKECINGMRNLYFDKDLRERLIKKGLERAKEFNWNKTINIILKNMEK